MSRLIGWREVEAYPGKGTYEIEEKTIGAAAEVKKTALSGILG